MRCTCGRTSTTHSRRRRSLRRFRWRNESREVGTRVSWTYSPALEELKLAIEKDANDHRAHFAAGVCYEMKGELPSALDHYKAANRIPKKQVIEYDQGVERIKQKLGGK